MNSAKQTLLVELFTEELPPKALKRIGEAFANGIHAGLISRGLVAADAKLEMFATPRRLAVLVHSVWHQAAQKPVKTRLMPAAVGLDSDGKPTAALEKKLQAFGLGYILNVDESVWTERISTEFDGKSAVLFHTDVASGVTLLDGLQAALGEAIARLPIPKLMSYQLADGLTTVQFVRPAHGLISMHGDEVIPVSILGLSASNITHGHRFQGQKEITLATASEYEARLEKEGGVIASFEKRRHEIERLLIAHAEQCGDTLGEREDYLTLLDEVAGLVEMPTVYVGQFEQEFLEVPAECLILTMKLNQKYFPLFHSEGGLSSRFLIVSNMRLDDPRNVIEGNQRVVRPRLADARFFFETDKKTKLADRLPRLASVVYHNKLGSQGERIARVRALARWIANEFPNVENANRLADQAAELAKADLMTDMVGEFPELQGTMGKYYALAENLPVAVAHAIEDHYKPRFAGDSLPRNTIGVIVSLADKMETLVGMFSIGMSPTGDKDPFALRRHAMGVVRLLMEKNIPIDLTKLVSQAEGNLEDGISKSAQAVRAFIFERFAGILISHGFHATEIDAVLSLQPERLSEVTVRLGAVREFLRLPQATSLASANKRIANILKKSDGVEDRYSPTLFADPAEKALADALERIAPVAREFLEAGDYTESLQSLAALREPVDTFFEQVMVNADDPAIRANRLGLLATLHREMNRVADLSRLAA